MIKGLLLPKKETQTRNIVVSIVSIIDIQPSETFTSLPCAKIKLGSLEAPNDSIWFEVRFEFISDSSWCASPRIITDGEQWFAAYEESINTWLLTVPTSNWIVPSKRQIAEAIDKLLCEQ